LPSRIRSFDRARDLLDRHVGIHAVLIEQIDPIRLEPLERRVGDLADVRRPAVQPRLLPPSNLNPNFVAMTT
jgi:hypothetical protein